MNKQTALQQLLALLNSDRFSVYPDIIPEIVGIIKNSGVERKAFNILATRIKFLSKYRHNAHMNHKEFEHLGSGIYSMHIAASPINLRILYAFKDPETILLLAFYEREGKNHTDYTGKIEEAKRRLASFD